MQLLHEKLGYASPEELLGHFPRRHEDRARWLDPFQVEPGETVTVFGTVTKQRFSRWRGGRSCLDVWIQPAGAFQTLRLSWFGISYLKNYLIEGARVVAHGKITETKRAKTPERILHHPEFELVKDDEDESIHLNRITPIYPSTEGVSQRAIRKGIYQLLSEDCHFEEVHPVPAGMMERDRAMRQIHFPDSWKTQNHARQRLVFDELFRLQVLLVARRQMVKRVKKVRPKKTQSLVEAFQSNLPFPMTGAQRRACAEVDADLAEPHPMNRLLQGDVGSGKTLVAVHALLRTLERGQNGALLAPTEILAEQHAMNLRRWLEPLGVQVELWTRTRKPDLNDNLFASNGRVFVGTHALIQEKVSIPNLGLGVVDEQHKFGVLQRAALQTKTDKEIPDLLVMTATPIPRTLCLTIYGDLDLSILDEMPPGRGSLRTVLRSEKELPKVWNFIQKEIQEGRQAYVVYPLVEDSEKVDLKSVEKEAEKLRELFQPHAVGILHGRMDPKEKEDVMRQFRNNEINVLVATTVIEVGVDVPNATVMVIENAERFGLAQLHQLRGRVGRGAHQSYCVLIGKPRSKDSWRRLKVMEETQDGFKLAEEDLKIRGPGNLLGTEQSGLPPLKLADFGRDWTLLQKARQMAGELLKQDPSLKKWPKFRKEILSHPQVTLTSAVN